MALAVRGSSLGSGNAAPGTSHSCTLNVGPSAGDAAIIIFAQNALSSGNYQTITPPSGFTTIGTVAKSDWEKLHVFGKQNCSGSEGTTMTCTFPGSTLDTCAIGAMVFSGASTSDAFGTAVTLDDTSSNTTYSIPGITTDRANSFVIACVSNGGNSSFATNNAAFSAWGASITELVDAAAEWSAVGGGYVLKASPGAFSATSATGAQTDTGLGITFELREPGAAAPVLSAATPSGTLGTTTTATLGATTDTTSGTFYGVVDSAGNISGITASQVKAGQNNAGGAPVASGNAAVSTTSPSAGMTGLTANTLYSYAVVQNSSSDSNVLTGTFTTATAVNPDFRKFGPQGAIRTLLTM